MLPFRAEQSLDGARSPAGRGRAPQRGRSLRGRRRPHGGTALRASRLFGAGDENTTRSAAGRAALEAVAFSPGRSSRTGASGVPRPTTASRATCRRSGRRSTSRSTATAPCATSTPCAGGTRARTLGLYPVRLRGPHRAALRRPRPPRRLQRRLVVRDTALRAVLPRRARVRHRLTAAARITARGASRPVQSSNARTPWATRMSIPEATAAPWRPAAASSAVPPGR